MDNEDERKSAWDQFIWTIALCLSAIMMVCVYGGLRLIGETLEESNSLARRFWSGAVLIAIPILFVGIVFGVIVALARWIRT